MDDSQSEEFIHRLLPVLQKILQTKNIEETYVDKIFSSIDDELRAQHSNVLSTLYEWLSETIEKWKKTKINSFEAEFLCKFIGFLCKYNEAFYMLQSRNVLSDLIGLLKNDLMKHTTMKEAFIKMLFPVLDHNAGLTWINTSEVWKLVVNIYFSNINLYVEREGVKFFKKLISAPDIKDSICENIFLHVFLLIQKDFNTIAKDTKINSNILPSLKLFEIILTVNLFSENNEFYSKIQKTCNFEIFLKHFIENFQEEMILEAVLVVQVLYSVLKTEDKKNVLSTENNPAVFDLFNILISHKQFNCTIRLAKYCHALWNKIRIQMNCQDTIGLNFISIQLFPSLMCLNYAKTDPQQDLFLKKIFSQKSPESQKFFDLLESSIKSSCGSKPTNLAAKSISSVIININNYNLEEAVLIFKAMMFLIKSLIFENGYDLETGIKRHKKSEPYGIEDKALLSTILNCVCLLLDKFKINWTNLEELGFFKLNQCLLKIMDLPSVVVQILLVVKVAVLNSIQHNAELSTVTTNLTAFASTAHELITNSSWEIRDSCIEVVTVIAELSNSKYPVFQQVLLEKNFDFTLMNIIENDTESYVRASALRALTIMTKIEVLNPFLNNQDFCLKITKLLETESEGIVRREAALLIREIYLTLNSQDNDLKDLFYKVMGRAALCDLYWEVKINSLYFWEAVIQCIITDQKIISKCSSDSNFLVKEVNNLPKGDVKLEVYKSLKKLSKIGCLHVLLTILKEDCDIIVIKKAAEVLSGLLNILKQYNVIETDNRSSCSTMYRKRKNSDLMENEKKKIPSRTSENSLCDILENNFSLPSDKSEKVIDEIVNETDINLLKNVSSENEETSSCLKLTFLKEIEPEAFLLQMENFDKDQFLENKRKSFINVETDLTLTINKINIEHSINEVNVMDCY